MGGKRKARHCRILRVLAGRNDGTGTGSSSPRGVGGGMCPPHAGRMGGEFIADERAFSAFALRSGVSCFGAGACGCFFFYSSCRRGYRRLTVYQFATGRGTFVALRFPLCGNRSEPDPGRSIRGPHDWVHFASISGVDGIPDLTEFRNRVVYGRYGVLTSEDLNALLSEHDEMWLVTDKAKDYSALLRQIPFPQRMLVEVFSHRGWRQARAADVVYPALNVGTMNIRKIWRMAFLGVDMVTVDIRELVAQRDLFEWLHRQGLTILAYTVDNEDLFRSLYGRCLDMA